MAPSIITHTHDIDTAIILAAGLGSRLSPLTNHCPKPLIKLVDKPLIAYAIEEILKVNIKKIIVNSHYLAPQIHEYLNNHPYDATFLISHEEQLLGTGGGVLNAMRKYNHQQPLLLVNSDILFCAEQPILQSLLERWQPHMHALLLLQNHHNMPHSYNLQADGLLSLAAPMYTYLGAAILAPALFNGYEVGYLQYIDLINQSIVKNEQCCYGITTDSKWFDLGSIERLNEAREFLLTRK